MAFQVYYLIGLDDEHRPQHTTRICASWVSTVKLQEEMSPHFNKVIICQELHEIEENRKTSPQTSS